MSIAQSSVTNPPHSTRRGIKPDRVLLYLLVIALCVLFGFPLFWTLMSSLKTAADMSSFPPIIIPPVPQWSNYLRVLVVERLPVATWFGNSLWITVLATSGVVITSSLVAYSFARFHYRGRDLLFTITLATLMLPTEVTLIPQFVLFHKLGWINTHLPLWVPSWFGGGGFAIFLMRQFFLTLPKDLDEAALIDGANYLRIFWSILLPLCKPVLATLAIITLIATWGDFLGPVIYLNSPDKFTISVGLNFFKNTPDVGGEPLQHILMAASVLSMIPIIIVFFLGQRYFVQGIVMSGIKG